MNLFFVIKTVLHLSVTTFFECEMKISYKEYISESENMEDYRDRRFQIKRYINNQTFIKYEYKSKLNY